MAPRISEGGVFIGTCSAHVGSTFFFFLWAKAATFLWLCNGSKVVTMQNLGLVGMITIEWPKALAGPFLAETVLFLRFWDKEKTSNLRVEERQTL